MIAQLRETCRRLLADGAVQVVIGYGKRGAPVFITKTEDAERLTWGEDCVANLAVYLTRKEVRALGKAAIVVKGCDERALVVLEKEAQIDCSGLYVIGVACNGVSTAPLPSVAAQQTDTEPRPEGAVRPRMPKCAKCEVRMPRFANEVIGEISNEPAAAPPAADPLAALMAKSPAERWAFWQAEFSRCIKCYACRQACPLCYCERCIADKNRPTCITPSASPAGNFAWHVTRAFHLAARCVGCGECTRACPVGIPLGLLNRSLGETAAREFGYRPGMDPAAEPVFGAWSAADKEDFIR